MAAPQQWYYRKGTARFGPVPGAELKKMAETGKLEPDDLLRRVGMSQWVPATKIKGLFAPPPVPKVEKELGLAPSTDAPIRVETKTPPKQVRKPAAPPTIAPKQVPMPQPVPPAASAPPASTSFEPDNSNPFADFGKESGPADAAGGAMNPMMPLDPFASWTTGGGEGGADPFAHLVALEKQGQTIYREPPPEEEPGEMETEKPKKPTDLVSSFGPLGVVGALGIPFVFIMIMGFVIGAVYGCGSIYVSFHIMSAIFAMMFSFMITIGTAKMVGALAGNCLLGARIKNETIAAGYGGLVGLVGIYFFMAGSFWADVNFNPWLMMLRQQIAEAEARAERGEEPVRFLEPDRPTVFQEPVAAEVSDEEESEDDAELAGDGGLDAEESGSEEDRVTQAKANDPSLQENEQAVQWAERILSVVPNGVSVFGSLWPIFVLISFVAGWWFWLIHGGLLVLNMAKATWMSNLGYDPTRD